MLCGISKLNNKSLLQLKSKLKILNVLILGTSNLSDLIMLVKDSGMLLLKNKCACLYYGFSASAKSLINRFTDSNVGVMKYIASILNGFLTKLRFSIAVILNCSNLFIYFFDNILGHF